MKIRPFPAITALLLAAASTAFADDSPADSPQRCRDILSHSGQLTAETAEPVGADGCAYGKLHITLGAGQAWTVERMTLSRLDFVRLAAGPQIPLTLRVEARGIRFSPAMRSKVAAYVMQTTIRPFDLTLDYDLPAGGGTLKLAEFSMRGRNVGDLRISGELVNVTPPMLQAPSTALGGPTALKSLKLHLDNQGFVESYLVAPLAGGLLDEAEDPEVTVAQMKQLATATMRGTLAATATPPATIDALAAFIAAFPHPDKVLDVAVSLPRPLGMADVAAFQTGTAKPAALIPAGALTASYAEAPAK